MRDSWGRCGRAAKLKSQLVAMLEDAPPIKKIIAGAEPETRDRALESHVLAPGFEPLDQLRPRALRCLYRVVELCRPVKLNGAWRGLGI